MIVLDAWVKQKMPEFVKLFSYMYDLVARMIQLWQTLCSVCHRIVPLSEMVKFQEDINFCMNIAIRHFFEEISSALNFAYVFFGFFLFLFFLLLFFCY